LGDTRVRYLSAIIGPPFRDVKRAQHGTTWGRVAGSAAARNPAVGALLRRPGNADSGRCHPSPQGIRGVEAEQWPRES